MKLHLAPLEDITGPIFRKLCYNLGADYTYTEMARLESLSKGNRSSWDKISLIPKTPTIAQILVNKTKGLSRFIEELQNKFPEIKGIDLNFGCSSPKILRCGLGAAMIKRVNRINEIIEEIKKNSDYSVSIKMRLGINNQEKEREVFLKTIKETEADRYIVHGRHGKQKLDQKSDWSIFNKCLDTGKVIVANGDIKSIEDLEYFKSIGIKELMIGRAAMASPEIFTILANKQAKGINFIKNEYLELLKRNKEKSKYHIAFLKNIR